MIFIFKLRVLRKSIHKALTKGNNPESRLCTSPRQNTRAGPCGVSVGEAVPKSVRAGQLAQLLVVCYTRWVSPDSSGELFWVVKIRENWWVDQLSYHPDTDPGLCGSPPHTHTLYLWNSGACDGAQPADPKLGLPWNKATIGYPAEVPGRSQYQ